MHPLHALHAFKLVSARAGLPGHLIYGRARNALEIVKRAFGGKQIALKIVSALHTLFTEEASKAAAAAAAETTAETEPSNPIEAREAQVALIASIILFELPKIAARLPSEASVGRVRRALGEYAVVVVDDQSKTVDMAAMKKTLEEVAVGYAVASPEARKMLIKSISGGVSNAGAANWIAIDPAQLSTLAVVSKAWDVSKVRTNTGNGWFGKESDISKWAGVKHVDESGE